MNMRKKTASPLQEECGLKSKKGNEPRTNTTFTTTPKINSERQRRAIIALVKYGAVSSLEMEKMAGARNVPELMAQLRRNGWQWQCELFNVLDRDGKNCKPGRYLLKPESLKIAKEMVKRLEENKYLV